MAGLSNEEILARLDVKDSILTNRDGSAKHPNKSDNPIVVRTMSLFIQLEHRADAEMDPGPLRFEGYSSTKTGTAALAETVKINDNVSE